MFSLVFTFVSIVLTLTLTICFVLNINEAISEGGFFNDF